MRLTATEGCTCYSYQIDGIEVADLLDTKSEHYHPELVKDAILRMINSEGESRYYELFQDLINRFGFCKFEYHCDQCDDDVYSFELEV